jgi:hypothetical protein
MNKEEYKGGLTPRQQLATCSRQHFLVTTGNITKKCCQLLPWCKAAFKNWESDLISHFAGYWKL